jgi:hypothetical protein
MAEKIALPATEINQVEVGDDTVLYIRLVDYNAPRTKTEKAMKMIKEDFQKLLPDAKVIVGVYDLRFSTISKKQAFKGKLDGKV